MVNTAGNCKVDITSAVLTLPGGGTRTLTCGSGTVAAGGTVQCTAETLTVTAALFSLGSLQASVSVVTVPSAADTSAGTVDPVTASATETVTAAVSAAPCRLAAHRFSWVNLVFQSVTTAFLFNLLYF
jgi:hypothetical protein